MKRKLFVVIMTIATIMTLSNHTVNAVTVDVSDALEHSTSVTVTASVGSSYSVSIPASFALEYQSTPRQYNMTDYEYYAEYTVGAKGNIPIGKQISIVPSSLTLTDENGTGSISVPVVIVQSKQAWGRTELLDNGGNVKTSYTTTSGYAYANITYAGEYSGQLTFTYQLTDTP